LRDRARGAVTNVIGLGQKCPVIQAGPQSCRDNHVAWINLDSFDIIIRRNPALPFLLNQIVVNLCVCPLKRLLFGVRELPEKENRSFVLNAGFAESMVWQ
jgi:hypothetical protein